MLSLLNEYGQPCSMQSKGHILYSSFKGAVPGGAIAFPKPFQMERYTLGLKNINDSNFYPVPGTDSNFKGAHGILLVYSAEKVH